MKANLESDPFLASELTVLKIGVLYTSSLGLTIVLPEFLNHIWVHPDEEHEGLADGHQLQVGEAHRHLAGVRHVANEGEPYYQD